MKFTLPTEQTIIIDDFGFAKIAKFQQGSNQNSPTFATRKDSTEHQSIQNIATYDIIPRKWGHFSKEGKS